MSEQSQGMNSKGLDFARRVVRWQTSHGRHDLPWQNTRDPYRVWLSEIMLQQTQVSTVLDYYARFLARFPDVQTLALAQPDDVLALWSGLGYYSRARNLHACAQQVLHLYGGEFPRSAQGLQTLPGIGRSTAAAVASLCFSERVAILDGNVKRVVTRFLGFDKDLALSAHERTLWDLASGLLPQHAVEQSMPRYTQGVMDLGATLCLRKKPQCESCPLADDCVARQQGAAQRYPVKSRKLKRSAQSFWLLWAQRSDGAVWLSQRPSPGIWGGLYCFALFDSREALQAAVPAQQHQALQDEPAFTHVLTHKDLHLHPVKLGWSARADVEGSGDWFGTERWAQLGLPAPVRKLLQA
ncbi:MAG: A/G-specific adenine glycosylase [Burkholderiaceae bacterium]